MTRPSFTSAVAEGHARARTLLRRSAISLAAVIVLLVICILGAVAVRSSGQAPLQGNPLLLTLSIFLGILVVSFIVLVNDIVRYRGQIRGYEQFSDLQQGISKKDRTLH
jgi:hypothetical protein